MFIVTKKNESLGFLWFSYMYLTNVRNIGQLFHCKATSKKYRCTG